jgi:uncharacterized membrane protein
MSLAPLLNASLAIQLHAFAAMAAFALGGIALIVAELFTLLPGRIMHAVVFGS